MNHRRLRTPRRVLAYVAGLATVLSIMVVAPVTVANADAGNPILGTIKASATDNGDGTVTVFVRGQWNWLSHGTDCNLDRAATGLGVAWNDLNGPGTTRGNNEVQRVTLSGATGGTFRLRFNGQNTGNIAFNATAAQLQAALVALSNIGPGDVSVTGGPGPNTPWDVEFTGALALQDVPAMTLNNDSLTPAAATVTITTPTNGTAAVFNGFLVENGNVRAYIGYKDATAVGGPTDQMVHPVDRGNQVEGYTVAGVDYPATQQFVDPSPPGVTATQVADWKGGCGRQPISATASKGSNPERTGLTCANGTTDCAGEPWGSWGYEKNGGFGYSHTYLKQLPNNGGSGLPDRVCVNFYDLHHAGGAGSQVPESTTSITVDANTDNSIDTNAFNVNDGANCVHVTGSALTTVATDTVVGGNIHDTATLSGIPANAGGTLTFKAYKRTGANPDCSGVAAFTASGVAVSGPGDYGSGNFSPPSAGTYDWLVTYSGDPPNLVLGTTAPCGDQTGDNDETSDVTPASPTVTTNAGPTVRFAGNPPGNDLTDTATLSGGFNPTGTITFTLYGPGDATCTGQPVGSDSKPVNGNGQYSGTVHVTQPGVYRWIANYGGDANNNQTNNTCNGTNENLTVINPSIEIAKTPDNQTIVTGHAATFHIKVTNTGDSTLTGVHVTDANSPGCARTAAQIAADANAPNPGTATFDPGDTYEYDCSSPTLTDDLHNVATATGTPSVGPDVTDSDDADVDVTHPQIEVLKDPNEQQVQSGGTVTFTITVTNTGDVALDNVAVTDALAPGCARTSAQIAADPNAPNPGTATFDPNDTYSYNCTKTNVQASFTNTAQACGTPSVTGPPAVCDDDTAHVTLISPLIVILKTPDEQTVVTGSTVTFHIKVTNTGDVPLTNVHVTDAQAPNCARTSAQIIADPNAPQPGTATFNPNDTYEYNCTKANVTASFTNSATATGTPPVGPDATDTDTAHVTVINPAITVEKGPNWQSVVTGNTVTFSITVTNTGDSTLTGVHVTDAQAPGCARTAAQIAADSNAPHPGTATFNAGDTYSYTCTRSVTATLTNVAQACGTPAAGPDVCDTDDANVGLEHLKSYPDFVPNDFADISVEGSTVPLNGHITFSLYKGTCTPGNRIYTQMVTVNGDGSYQTTNNDLLSDLINSINTGGTYNWQLTYSGDSHGNADINGTCGTEHFTLTTGADAQ